MIRIGILVAAQPKNNGVVDQQQTGALELQMALDFEPHRAVHAIVALAANRGPHHHRASELLLPGGEAKPVQFE